MKWKFMAQTAAYLMSWLKIKAIPLDAENKQVAFNAEQESQLTEKFGTDYVEGMKKALNKELATMHDDSLEMKAIQDEIDAMVQEAGITAEELETIAKNEKGDKSLLATVQAIAAKQKQHNEMFEALVAEPIGDAPMRIVGRQNANVVKHSATHLFASGKSYDGLDRPWNRRAVNQNGASATNFMDAATVSKLNEDLELFYRENPTALKSLTRDSYGLPTFWPTRTKVDDKVADGFIATAEITQSRKLPWLPKNRQLIQAEEGQIFPIQIDIEFVGYYLQKIEASWLNMLNKEGSQPYKESFVNFLVSEISKKARIEDRVATIKGIYVATPDGATEGGRYINRQNGLFYLLKQARDITKKYRPFDVGMPTTTNIVDYVDNMIKSLPQDVREQQGLVFYLSDEWLRAYKRRSEVLFGLNNDYTGYPESPKDFPNIKFERLIDAAGSDFMFITFDDNIEILENIPNEKSMYRFEYLKRIMYIWADYKLGVRLVHIGTQVEVGDPLEFSVQTVWSNTAPIFTADTFIPVHEDGLTKVTAKFNNIQVTKDRTSTITEFTNIADYKGQVIKIKGNTLLAATLNVVHNNSKLKLAGNANFDLKTGGTLTLFVPADGSVPFELARTSAPETAVVPDANFDSATIDANDGIVFNFDGTATTAVTNIVNGVQGKTITIHGTDAVGIDVTLATAGVIKMNSAATLASLANNVQLTLVDGLWIETARQIV